MYATSGRLISAVVIIHLEQCVCARVLFCFSCLHFLFRFFSVSPAFLSYNPISRVVFIRDTTDPGTSQQVTLLRARRGLAINALVVDPENGFPAVVARLPPPEHVPENRPINVSRASPPPTTLFFIFGGKNTKSDFAAAQGHTRPGI